MKRTSTKLSSFHEEKRRRFQEPVHGVLSEYDGRQVLYPVAVLDLLAEDRTAQELWGDALDWDAVDQARVERELDRLDPYEADLIELALAGCRQEDLGVVFDKTQAAISYRLNRGISNLVFLCRLPEVTTEEIETSLGPWLDKKDVSILLSFRATRNMHLTARTLRLNSGTVRFRIFKALEFLEVMERPEFKRSITFFRALCKRVARPRLKTAERSTPSEIGSSAPAQGRGRRRQARVQTAVQTLPPASPLATG